MAREAPASAGRWGSDRLDPPPARLLASRDKRRACEGLSELGLRLGFRIAGGFAHSSVYREFFPHGLTAPDNLDAITFGERPSLRFHVMARQEVRARHPRHSISRLIYTTLWPIERERTAPMPLRRQGWRRVETAFCSMRSPRGGADPLRCRLATPP